MLKVILGNFQLLLVPFTCIFRIRNITGTKHNIRITVGEIDIFMMEKRYKGMSHTATPMASETTTVTSSESNWLFTIRITR